MTEDKLSFLRDEQGRFAPKEDTQPAPEANSAPPASPEPPPQAPAPDSQTPAPVQPVSGPVQPPPGYIPMAAVLDEREKRQRLERELEEVRRKVEAAEKPQAPIDPIADPDGFNRQLEMQRAKDRWEIITSLSHATATRQHGAEKVRAAEEWLAGELQSNPHFWTTVQRQVDPYDFVVQQHQRFMRLSKIGDDDPEAWAQKWAEANGYIKAPTQAVNAGTSAPSPQSTPLPRPSLASAPSAGGKGPSVPVGPGEAFNAVFRN
jgi:hypothetical protein